MKNFKILAGLLLGSAVLFSSCSSDDDDPEIINESETITTVIVTLTDSSSNSTEYEYYSYGGNTNVDDIHLTSGEMYDVSIKFLDESDPNDVEDITEEIQEEKDDHFIVFAPGNGLALTIMRTDGAESTRTDGNKVGLESTWTSAATAGTNDNITISLIHEATSVDDSDELGSVTGGETDAQVTFPVVVE